MNQGLLLLGGAFLAWKAGLFDAIIEAGGGQPAAPQGGPSQGVVTDHAEPYAAPGTTGGATPALSVQQILDAAQADPNITDEGWAVLRHALTPQPVYESVAIREQQQGTQPAGTVVLQDSTWNPGGTQVSNAVMQSLFDQVVQAGVQPSTSQVHLADQSLLQYVMSAIGDLQNGMRADSSSSVIMLDSMGVRLTVPEWEHFWGIYSGSQTPQAVIDATQNRVGTGGIRFVDWWAGRRAALGLSGYGGRGQGMGYIVPSAVWAT